MALNEVQTENSLPGTPNWELSNPAIDREIEGYASLTSVNKGKSIDFYVSTKDSNFQIEVYRTGWYGGVGARLLQKVPNLPGKLQTTPSPDPTTGLIECHWATSYTLNVPTTWTSGIFLVRLTSSTSHKQSFIIFVIRDDERDAALFYQLSVSTYQAYNFWPGGANGKSLYDWAPGKRAWKVSFNRPYVLGNSYAPDAQGVKSGLGAGEYLTNLQPNYYDTFSPAGFEYNMVRWLEKNGFDVTYGTNIDVHENANLLDKYRGFLSVGHDEYWSMSMRNNIESALANGVNLGFFTSNPAYWQVRFEPASDGVPNRTMVCYKYDAEAKDPQHGTPTSTLQWRNAPVNMPEAALIGVEYVADPVNSDIVISQASHWLLDGTGLKNGNRLKGLLGYEVDACIPGTSPDSIEILARSPIGDPEHKDFPPNWPGASGPESNVTWYTNGSTSVFATGSMQWSWGLDDYNAPALRPILSQRAAGKITSNVLTSFTSSINIAMPALLPAFMAQQLDTLSFRAIGGEESLTWSASGLPPYLTMSPAGVLSGTPPAVATQTNLNFSVAVKDANGESASKTFTLPITPARTISVQFVGKATPMTASESAGVISKANWNNATGTSSSGSIDLVDESGTAVGANVAWRSDDVWSTPITDVAGNTRMMKGYLDTGAGNPTWISVAGLPICQNGYDVYVYVDGDNGSGTKKESYTLSVPGENPTTITATDDGSSNFNGTFRQATDSAGNYIKFSVESTAFTLTATPGPASDSVPRAPVNGIQIVPR